MKNNIEQNHLYNIGDVVSFERNISIKSEGTPIVSKVDRDSESMENVYIIEHETGWTPNSLRTHKFGLDVAKKYLFVNENELTLVNN